LLKGSEQIKKTREREPGAADPLTVPGKRIQHQETSYTALQIQMVNGAAPH